MSSVCIRFWWSLRKEEWLFPLIGPLSFGSRNSIKISASLYSLRKRIFITKMIFLNSEATCDLNTWRDTYSVKKWKSLSIFLLNTGSLQCGYRYFTRRNARYRGPIELVRHSAYRVSSHWRKGAINTSHIIFMVWLYLSPIPVDGGGKGACYLFMW